MDPTEAPNGSRSALRQPFIDTANALASLYKKAVSAEREARDAGERAAYMRIMEWAARKSRASERITPAELMNFCSSELATLPPPVPVSARTGPEVRDTEPNGSPVQSPPAQQVVPPQPMPPVAYVTRDDNLVSDIRKLHVNPRKRQRVDISDTFVSACQGVDSGSLIMSQDGYVLRARDNVEDGPFLQTEPGSRPPGSAPVRRESRDTPNEYTIRKGKNSKNHVYDKLRRK